MKSVLLIGMGKFGQTLGEKLLSMGNEVMIVDKDEVTVKVTANDTLSGIANVEYYEANKAMTLDEVNDLLNPESKTYESFMRNLALIHEKKINPLMFTSCEEVLTAKHKTFTTSIETLYELINSCACSISPLLISVELVTNTCFISCLKILSSLSL